jgi:hypothetical protein
VESSQSVRAPSSSSRVGERGRITKPSRRGGRAGGRSRGGSRAAGISRLSSSTPTSSLPPNIDFNMHIGVYGFTRNEEHTHHASALQLQGLRHSDVPADVSQMHIHNEQDLDLELDPTAASLVGSFFGPAEAYGSGR